MARWQSPWATVLLTIIVSSSFVAIVIKALGLNIIFAGRPSTSRHASCA